MSFHVPQDRGFRSIEDTVEAIRNS
jgi:hypothetical protein